MADQVPPEAKSDPTYKRYNIRCRIKFFEKDIEEDVGKGKTLRYHRKMVLLIPQEGDERTRFLMAWCPSEVGTKYELAGLIGSPVNSPCRFAVFMGHDEKLEQPYLIVMSKGIEDILVRCREGDSVLVTTLPANEDAEADNVDVSSGNYNPV